MKFLIREYLVKGLSVRDIALAHEVSESRVRAALAEHRINIPPDKIRDEVCEAIAWAGHGSFAGFMRQHKLKPLAEQAEALGVNRNGLHRLYEIINQLAEEL